MERINIGLLPPTDVELEYDDDLLDYNPEDNNLLDDDVNEHTGAIIAEPLDKAPDGQASGGGGEPVGGSSVDASRAANPVHLLPRAAASVAKGGGLKGSIASRLGPKPPAETKGATIVQKKTHRAGRRASGVASSVTPPAQVASLSTSINPRLSCVPLDGGRGIVNPIRSSSFVPSFPPRPIPPNFQGNILSTSSSNSMLPRLAGLAPGLGPVPTMMNVILGSVQVLPINLWLPNVTEFHLHVHNQFDPYQ